MAFLPKSKKEKANKGATQYDNHTPTQCENHTASSVKITPKYTIPTSQKEKHKTPRKRGVVSDVKNRRGKNSEANAISSEGNTSEVTIVQTKPMVSILPKHHATE